MYRNKSISSQSVNSDSRFYKSTDDQTTREKGSLPRQFLNSMRILFDILDDDNSGYVHFKEIENYWRNENSRETSDESRFGILRALEDLTLPDGTLSFDRFVMALKLALLESESSAIIKPPTLSHIGLPDTTRSLSIKSVNSNNTHTVPTDRTWASYQNLNQKRYILNPKFTESCGQQPSATSCSKPVTAMVRPNNYKVYEKEIPSHGNDDEIKSISFKPVLPSRNRDGELHPPRIPKHLASERMIPPAVPPRKSSKNVITNELKHRQSQQLEIAAVFTMKPSNHEIRNETKSSSNEHLHNYAFTANARSIVPVQESRERVDDKARSPRKVTNRRDSTRRHTISSGIDGNMLKRMRQLQQEKMILLRGLDGVECGREWYQSQIDAVELKLQNIGNSVHTDNSLEANQERMNFLTSRVNAIDQHIRVLIDSSKRGFPIHMNLTLSSVVPKQESRLKDDLQRLHQVIIEQNQRIAQLEQEKSSLIRQLFAEKSVVVKNPPLSSDNTFLL